MVTESVFGPEYQKFINSIYETIGPVPVALIVLAVCLLGGFGISRICKLAKVPYVTGYIILGILIGPSLLGIIPGYMLTGVSNVGIPEVGVQVSFAGLSFIGDLCMGFIAFSIGKFFKYEKVKKHFKLVFLVSFLTSLVVGLLVGGATYLVYNVFFHEPFNFAPAFIMGTVAMAVSPTATSSIVRQYKAKGSYVNKIFQNIIVMDMIAILSFTVVIGIVAGTGKTGVSTASGFDWSIVGTIAKSALIPIGFTILMCGVGILLGWCLSLLNNYKRTNDSRIILVISFTAVIVALCSVFKISPLLPGIFFGIFYFNFAKSESLFLQLENFLPPVLCVFFVISGSKLDFSNFAYPSVLVVALVMAIFRSGGQLVGAQTFGRLWGYDKEVHRYLPLSMMCITSVAVGLMNMATVVLSGAGEEVLEMINYCYTIVLTCSVVLELIGPTFAKVALIKTNSVDPATLIKPTDPKKAKLADPGDISAD